MLNFDYLFKGNWVSIVQPHDIPTEYEVLHEADGVLVMPLIITPKNSYVIIRKEFCPPYIMKTPEYKQYYTVISGTRDDNNEEPFSCMLRELQEEAGIEPLDYEVLWKTENMPMYKGSDRRSWNYIIKINSFKMHEPQSDGTMGENLSKSVPITIQSLENIIKQPNCDFLLYSMYHILFNIIQSKNL